MLTIETTDLEAQDHVLRYQLPVAIKKHNVGLVVIDSVAANFRAEFESNRERDGGASLAKRGKELMQLGAMLRRLAREEGVAVVVANQVGDRFTKPPSSTPSRTTSANTEQSERGPASAGTPHAIQATPGGNDQLAKSSAGSRLLVSPDPLALDHQQRWFTGWGDIADAPAYGLKTPSLGHVWTNQLSCRIALLKEPVFTSRPLVVSVNGEDRLNEDVHVSKWQRWLKVVFAAWAPPSEGRGVPFELSGSGIRHLPS
ncbi:hypothetical protein M011DRAFT_472653 [Sporormia fimetaria CBS 119925]|uniref:RecA family profile 1 domain-containing protein n=1 Tax=Sporormia fimetaria CBS 119925 TaxID=1340428 RepID=A0A6A6UY60_9PLEO|nr:hypothetical protein M011DRAFT_472653 [Sporormia fimetaria CBS 119925]